MKNDELAVLMNGILEDVGLTNIDKSDIDRFVGKFVYIDAEKICGENYEIGILLERAIAIVDTRNCKRAFSGLLFAIKMPKGQRLPMEYLSRVHNVLEQIDDTVECVWGLSNSDKLCGDNVEIIVALGFN